MATTESWKDRDGNRQEKTEWHRVVLWSRTAEALNEYLVKGKQIAVEGKLQTREWTDKDGNKRYTTEIRADRIVLLGGGSDRDGQQRERQQRRGTRERTEDAPVGADPAFGDDQGEPTFDTSELD